MSAATVVQGYTVDDLDLARLRFETPHVELDPWGNLVVTPATDPHEFAIHDFHVQLFAALQLADIDARVYVGGPAWRTPGGSGYTNQPDLTVLAADTRRSGADELHLAPPPLLVVEVASPSTRAVDRSRKRSDYLLGGARGYLMVDLPRLTPVQEPTATLVLRVEGAGEVERGPFVGRVELDEPFPMALDLEALRWTGRWA